MNHLRTLLITLAKITISLGIIGYLLYSVLKAPSGRQAFFDMLAQPKDWGLLAAAGAALLAAVVITLIRWRYLVLALGVDLSMADTMRIGFVGCMFNFLPTGIAGGDVLKAWMLGKEKPGKRAHALASVVVDRIIGLYVLFLVAAGGIFITGLWRMPNHGIRVICWGLVGITAVSTIGIAVVLVPGFLESPIVQALARVPKIGRSIGHLLAAIIDYRTKRATLFWTSVATIPVHALLALEIYLLAMGLGFNKVSCRDYFIIYPLSGIAQVVPVPAGPTESGIVYLYKTLRLRDEPEDDPEAHKQAAVTAGQQGLILALAYRLSTFLVIPIGAVYYFFGARQEVQDLLHDIEEGGPE